MGIASFTYLYKKCDTVFAYAHKEFVMAAVVSLTVVMLLSYIRYFHGQTLKVSQVLHLPMELLSALPLINKFIPQTSTLSHSNTESTSNKVRH